MPNHDCVIYNLKSKKFLNFNNGSVIIYGDRSEAVKDLGGDDVIKSLDFYNKEIDKMPKPKETKKKYKYIVHTNELLYYCSKEVEAENVKQAQEEYFEMIAMGEVDVNKSDYCDITIEKID